MLADKILYYPYVNIPNNLWTTRALLYWDNIGVIVPHDYIYNPEKLDSHMRDLVAANLVKQIIPVEFTDRLPNFRKSFMEMVHRPNYKISLKKENFTKGKHLRIHAEKFDDLLWRNSKKLDWPDRNIIPGGTLRIVQVNS